MVKYFRLLIVFSGKEYGTASIEIHLKACRKKWDIEQEQKPPKERRPCPEPPKSFDEVIIGAKSGANVDLVQYNNEAF